MAEGLSPEQEKENAKLKQDLHTADFAVKGKAEYPEMYQDGGRTEHSQTVAENAAADFADDNLPQLEAQARAEMEADQQAGPSD